METTSNSRVYLGKIKHVVSRKRHRASARAPTTQEVTSAAFDKRSFWVQPPELGLENSRCSIWLERRDFYCSPGRLRPGSEPYLLLGFDTEYKTPPKPLESDEIREGKARSLILSYQFHAKTSAGKEWNGICIPENDERLTLTDFLLFALGTGARVHGLKELPTKIYLVGHFTRADLPAFANFQDLSYMVSAVRNTFISIDQTLKIQLLTSDGEPIALDVLLRDTILLTPQSSRSLKEIGKLVGVKKVELSEDRSTFKKMIRNMDQLRRDDWDLFKRYALTDAEICVRYIEKVIALYRDVTGKNKVPVTLGSIGIDLLLKTWQETLSVDPLTILGKEETSERYFSKRLGYYVSKKKIVDITEVHRHTAFVTESYHGGRGEQFWFGPGFEDDWSDFDLSSAYPTAMSVIGLPKWNEIHNATDVELFTAETLGFAEVEFEFPPEVRYPTLPIRTGNGLIFPRTGTSFCAAPEIYVARQLGAKLNIKYGVIVPTDNNVRIFGIFIKNCLERRLTAGKNTLEGLFWKEISNSTYGKTAQGLREKRVYDLRDRETKMLPASGVTNAYFASFITSFTRAVLGEIINSVPKDRMVFSCTTDGFLSNITDAEARQCASGELGEIFARRRQELIGTAEVIDKKHAVQCPLGWRTRGQATLIPGVTKADQSDFHIVLAKGGIFTSPEFEDDETQNDEIVRMFFEREPATQITIEAKTGVRQMIELDADFVERIFSKRLNMEYDWKRCPLSVTHSELYGHIAFSTRPWTSNEQFASIREAWEDYTKGNPSCLKSMDDYKRFAKFVEARSFKLGEEGKYLRKEDGDVDRLRQLLCSAYKQSRAGLNKKQDGPTDDLFAKKLSGLGIQCTKFDVENGKKREFVPHSCPPTDRVVELLTALGAVFPSLDRDCFVFQSKDSNPLKIAGSASCSFVDRVV